MYKDLIKRNNKYYDQFIKGDTSMQYIEFGRPENLLVHVIKNLRAEIKQLETELQFWRDKYEGKE